MAETTPIACPNCAKALNVPAAVLGKKIKCKECGTAFVAEAPKKGARPSKPGGAAKPKPEPQPEEPKKPKALYADEDDEGDGGAKPNPLGMIAEEDVPRCPHCAKELDPPDAALCIHCGFNNVTRTKANTKKVYAPDANDYLTHLGPGVAALLIFVALIVVNVICFTNMKQWMTDGFLDFLKKDEKGADGDVAFLVKPGAFITFVLAATVIPLIRTGRFALKRLVLENRPTERQKL